MNFDEIKDNWEKANSELVSLPKSISELGKAQLPIDKLKRNMRRELVLQIFTFILLPFFFRLNYKPELQEILLGVFVIFVLISGYYFYHFYQFYIKNLSFTGSSKDNLYELYYELKLNLERYRSLGFLLLPFVIIIAALGSIQNAERLTLNWQEAIQYLEKFLLEMIVASVVYIYIVIVWVNNGYGNHARQIKNILDELKESEL